jgi:pimeloyl-ACP methyl ester carboxylesterase
LSAPPGQRSAFAGAWMGSPADRIETGTVLVDGVSIFYRRRPGEGPPAVFVHGVPTSSEEFSPFLVRLDGPVVAIDLPGFGRSERPPPERFDCSMRSYVRLFGRLLGELGIDRYSLCVHDWGAVAMIAAMAEPERVQRLVVIDAVVLLPGYRWHRLARLWRTPILGELSWRLWTRRLVALALRESRGDWGRPDPDLVEIVWGNLDAGTARAILALYRSAPERELELAGRGLAALTAPALVVWGLRDRYCHGRFGRAYAERLPDATLLELPEAGHWPWREDPSVVDRVVAFLEAGAQPSPSEARGQGH